MPTLVLDVGGLPITDHNFNGAHLNFTVPEGGTDTAGQTALPSGLAIPNHVYTAASWQATYSLAADGMFWSVAFALGLTPYAGGHLTNVLWATHNYFVDPPATYTLESPVAQSGDLALINAAAGGTLPLVPQVTGVTVSGCRLTISAIRLTLTYNDGGGGGSPLSIAPRTIPSLERWGIPSLFFATFPPTYPYTIQKRRFYHPHTRRVWQFGRITFLNGYARGVNVAQALGTLAGTEFWHVNSPGPRANVDSAGVLRVYADDGSELTNGSALSGVDLMQIGF